MNDKQKENVKLITALFGVGIIFFTVAAFLFLFGFRAGETQTIKEVYKAFITN